MALPLVAVAGTAIRVGIFAWGAYALVRRKTIAPKDYRAEFAMDDIVEGAHMRRDQGQANATMRWKRVIRIGSNGPGIELDATGLGRIKFRKVNGTN